jgi:hypothetical protein
VEDHPRIEPSFLGEAVYPAAGWWTEGGERMKKQWARQLREHLNEDAIDSNMEFPYDRQRFYFLRELIGTSAVIRAGGRGA